VTLSVPLYDKGVVRAQTAVAAAELATAQARLREEQEGRVARLETTRQSYLETIRVLRERVALAERTRALYEKSRAAYQRGAMSVTDLTDDETRLYAAELAAEHAVAVAHRAAAELCRLLGRAMLACAR
jgi:outer membrane protein TolC